MQKRQLGTILILLGALLLAGALGLLGYNQWDNGRAQKAAAQVLDQLETTLDEQENHLQLLVPTQVDDTAREMTVTAIDGWDYIGYLSIPSIGLALPVMSEWSYPGLKIDPGRYAGSVFTDDLVICGHNYARHFSPVKRLAVGPTVQFVDMDGREWDYTVSKVETLQPTQIEEMVGKADGDVLTWDIRMKKPNHGDYLTTGAAHTLEHLFATYARNSAYKDGVIYVGPMGCRTGFYLLTRGLTPAEALALTVDSFRFMAAFEGAVPGASEVECGNYRDMDLPKAKAEAAAMLPVLEALTADQLHY